ncbi:MAG TPA: OsmC family protein [Dongiaceae bacterium]|nr:OsmC family protein [Dongiaceae bacterium]
MSSETDCAIRARIEPGGVVRVVTRNLTVRADGRLSLDPDATLPSALDLLMSALATDLVAGFAREAARERITIHDLELRLAARLDHPLAALGVVGETGGPEVSEIRGTLDVTGDADEPQWRLVWSRVLGRATVHATLGRAVELHITLQPLP